MNLERVAAPTAGLTEVDRLWHQAGTAALGATPEDWAAAQERMSMDRCDTVEDQLAWLTQAGLADAGCWFRDHLLAVLVARPGVMVSVALGSGQRRSGVWDLRRPRRPGGLGPG